MSDSCDCRVDKDVLLTFDPNRLIEKDYMEREEGNMYSYIA